MKKNMLAFSLGLAAFSSQAFASSEAFQVICNQFQGKRISQTSAASVTLNCQKLTYTARGSLNLNLHFTPISEKERIELEKETLGSNTLDVDLTEDQLDSAFVSTSEETFEIKNTHGNLFVGKVTAKTIASGEREVTMDLSNQTGDENSEPTRKRLLVLTLGKNGQLKAKLTSHRLKSYLVVSVWEKTFFGQSSEMKVQQNGLELIDESFRGRVSDVGSIRSAMSDSSVQNFRELLKK
jgi:hypothetical protein